VDLLGGRGGALVYEAEEVPETPPLRALWHHSETHLVANQDHGFREPAHASNEPPEFLQRSVLLTPEHPGRDPKGEGIQQHRAVPARGIEDRSQAAASELQQIPTGASPLTVCLYAMQEVRVFRVGEGGRDVEDALAAQREGTLFGEGALAAAGAANKESVDRYGAVSPITPRNVSTSRPFAPAPRTATRKKPGPSPIKGPQPRTRMPRLASLSGSHSGPRASKKLAAPG